MKKIILIRVVRTKSDKTMLIWCDPVSDKAEKCKGFNEHTQWFDDLDIFDKLDGLDFGVLCDAELGYSEPDYKGLCSVEIKSLVCRGKKII